MNKVKEKRKVDKISILLQEGRNLYHTQDLAVLWGIDNPNTLYTTIKRYIKRGVLYRIHKGFYSTVPVFKIDPIKIGLISLHKYAYVSTESVLVDKGIIFQGIKTITLVSNISKKFKIGNLNFLVRKMDDKYLYNDIGVVNKGGKRIASVERAVADMLYFNPHYHFDAKESIDWNKVEEIRKEMGYK